jgi:hypothetical protein
MSTLRETTGMQMSVFWVVAASIIWAMMEAARTSETSVNLYQAMQRNNPEDNHLLLAAVRT